MSKAAPVAFAFVVALAACAVDGPDSDNDDGGAATGNGASTGAQTSSGETGSGQTGSGGATSGGGAAQGSGGVGGGSSTSSGTGGSNEPCPDDVVCVTSYPFSHTATTTTAVSDVFDVYGCGPQDESGPEVVYRLDVPSDGFLWLSLGGMAVDVDIDVHLLGSLDPNDCLDRGHWEIGELLPAGQYYVTADTWVSEDGTAYDGEYTLELGLLTLADLQSWGVSQAVAADALHVFDSAWEAGLVDTSAYAIVDFSLHAAEERMWVLDVFAASLAYKTFGTVGEASDPNGDGWADVFSNVSGSHQSSLGLMKAAETYSGDFGQSVRLDGLEPGYNDNVRSRAIVIHPWNGSAPAYVSANPATGAAHTWGCLGIDPAIAVDLRDFLSEGGLVLSHFPDGNWSSQSTFLP